MTSTQPAIGSGTLIRFVQTWSLQYVPVFERKPLLFGPDSVGEAPALNCSLCSAQSADGPGTLIRCVKLEAHNLQFTFLK